MGRHEPDTLRRDHTYGMLASAVGSAPRAIGGACGANPIPIILPCHRVVAAGDKLGGYSGAAGVDTKIFLLELEGAPLEIRPPLGDRDMDRTAR